MDVIYQRQDGLYLDDISKLVDISLVNLIPSFKIENCTDPKYFLDQLNSMTNPHIASFLEGLSASLPGQDLVRNLAEFKEKGAANFHFWDKGLPGIYQGNFYHIRDLELNPTLDIQGSIDELRSSETSSRRFSSRWLKEVYTDSGLVVFTIGRSDIDSI